MDSPDLCGKPIVVSQFNSGGFVAVSYAAKATGLRKGDGVGKGGRASIAHLRNMKPPSRSVPECHALCANLQVLPMRTDRYREVSASLQEHLSSMLPDGTVVERASCDDFYIDVSPLITDAGFAPWETESVPGPPDRLRFWRACGTTGGAAQGSTSDLAGSDTGPQQSHARGALECQQSIAATKATNSEATGGEASGRLGGPSFGSCWAALSLAMRRGCVVADYLLQSLRENFPGTHPSPIVLPTGNWNLA